MKIEDKDIDKLLEDFQGADIKVPDNLDEKLNEKLNSIKPNKKYKSVSKYLVSSVLICILSYGFIPSFRIFANNVFVQQTRTIVFLWHTFGITGAPAEYWKHGVTKVLIPKA